ncbi:MAG: hypothetical protein Q8L22_00565 [Reyranella sp.]|nr:hypothetical protein [Reyranella sp.]
MIIDPMKRFLAASAVLALGACAAADGGDKSPGKYAGTAEQALIAAWGPPSSIEEAGDTRYLSYRQHRAFYIPAATPICPPGECVPLGGAKSFMLNESCTTTFAVEDGKVKSWRRDGKACAA